MSTSIAVVGARGFGRYHLTAIADLANRGIAHLAAVVDPLGIDEVPNIPDATPTFASLEEMLASVVPDVTVIATPIHTHLPLATLAMEAGSDVLVEKPTTASLAEFEELLAACERTGRVAQVGFQSFGSQAFAEIDRRIASGSIGAVHGIGALGTWIRATSYYDRARWAGKRQLDGREVVDGVVTNPLAHSVATALRIAGAHTVADVSEVVTDLYHAHDIEADDTSAVRIHTTKGITISLGLTLAASINQSPTVTVYGSKANLVLRYTEDVLDVEVDGEVRETERFGRTGLLENLIEHLTVGTPLVAAVQDSGAFMAVLEAVRTAPDPAQIAPAYLHWLDDDHGNHPVVIDVEHWCEQVARTGQTFTELGAPWTRASA